MLAVGCTQKKDITVRGMSYSPKSNYSYMGTAERMLDLKFSILKSAFSSESVITAIVVAPFNYNYPVLYKWKLGQGIELSDHQILNGELKSLEKNLPQKIVLNLKDFSDQKNLFIRFEIVGTDPKNRIFTDGIVTSVQKKSFESIVQEVEKINAK